MSHLHWPSWPDDIYQQNWPSNPWVECLEPMDFAITCEVELVLIDELDAKFKDEVEHEEFLDVCDTFFGFMMRIF